MSGDPEQAYFADGMTEDLITDLSKVAGLLVIARNSTFAYKGKPKDIREIAKALGVRYVLEGSVRRSGGEIRVNAQLIDATTGGHVWADRYDGEMKNIFGLQDNVTRNVVTALAVKLTKEDQERVARRSTENTEAYDVFLKGWQHYLRRTPEDFRAAIDHFKKAIELDPKYSRAYAALAATYWEASTSYWDFTLGLIAQLRGPLSGGTVSRESHAGPDAAGAPGGKRHAPARAAARRGDCGSEASYCRGSERSGRIRCISERAKLHRRRKGCAGTGRARY